MNIILLERSDYIAPHRVLLNDRRAQHIRDILGATIDTKIKVGEIDGLLGTFNRSMITAPSNSPSNSIAHRPRSCR